MKQWIAFVCAVAFPLIASDAPWVRLQTLRPGERISIDYSKGDKRHSVKAEMVSWTEDNLTVRIKKRELALPRSEVRKVAVYAGKTRARGAGIGAAVGAGVGAVFYGAVVAGAGGDLDVPPAAVIAGGSAFFGGIGALIGLGVGSTKWVPVYQAPGK